MNIKTMQGAGNSIYKGILNASNMRLKGCDVLEGSLNAKRLSLEGAAQTTTEAIYKGDVLELSDLGSFSGKASVDSLIIKKEARIWNGADIMTKDATLKGESRVDGTITAEDFFITHPEKGEKGKILLEENSVINSPKVELNGNTAVEGEIKTEDFLGKGGSRFWRAGSLSAKNATLTDEFTSNGILWAKKVIFKNRTQMKEDSLLRAKEIELYDKARLEGAVHGSITKIGHNVQIRRATLNQEAYDSLPTMRKIKYRIAGLFYR